MKTIDQFRVPCSVIKRFLGMVGMGIVNQLGEIHSSQRALASAALPGNQAVLGKSSTECRSTTRRDLHVI